MSYAIIRTGGKQFRVEPGQRIRIPSLEAEPGSKVTFEDVLLGAADGNVRVGGPTLSGAKVTGEVVKHGKGDKIVVFKFKRRKNYARKQGHRQKYTEVRIADITLG
jgi:large subunit ribosomal protein L21